MKTIRTLALLGFLGLTAAAPAMARETTIQPGWWESSNTLNLVISNTERERRCITPADVDKILAGRINRHYTCTYPEKRVAGGKMFFKGTCVDKRGRTVNVTATGPIRRPPSTSTPSFRASSAACRSRPAPAPAPSGSAMSVR